MIHRALVFASLGAILTTACGSDTPPAEQPLPVNPQVFPNEQLGFVIFGLVPFGGTSDRLVTFSNNGQNDLVFSRIDIEGGGQFQIVSVSSTTVASKDLTEVLLRFSPTTRGVQLSELVAESNAENFPEVRLELVGPAGAAPLANAPDVIPFETSVTVESVAGVGAPAAFVRLFNVGQRTAALTGYDIMNDMNMAFAFFTDIALPGVACDPMLGSQACDGGLRCTMANVCENVAVGTDNFVVLPLGYSGTAMDTATVRIHVIDPSAAMPVETLIDITVTGN